MSGGKQTRCAVCGQPVEPKVLAIRISRGTINGKAWKERSLFGVVHLKCFAASVESPKTVMDELRKAAREPPTESASR